MTHPILVLGTTIGSGALLPEHLPLLAAAEVLFGGAALLAQWGGHCPMARRIALGGPEGLPFADACDAVLTAWQAGERVVALADGDPLFYGLGASLARLLPPAALHLVPGISSLQAACARLNLPWAGMAAVSLHGRGRRGQHDEREGWKKLGAAVRRGGPICVLGDAHHTSATVAAWLLDRGADWLHLHLFAQLNTPHECHWSLSLPQAAAGKLADSPADSPADSLAVAPQVPGLSLLPPLSGPTLILIPEGSPRAPRLCLVPDVPHVDHQLITKGPVRATALAGLDIAPRDTVWDIGAGSGSVAFGAAALAWSGQVWAVERHPERVAMLHANRRHVAALNVEIVSAHAPEGLTDLPDPDAVFVGGGLGGDAHKAALLLDTLYARLRPGGRLAVACVLTSSLERFQAFARNQGLTPAVTLVQAGESAPLAQDIYFQGHNPVFVARLTKEPCHAPC